MNFPADNDSVGESEDDELIELQRMVRDNEEALKRAKNMIAELKSHLDKGASKAKETSTSGARRPRKKRQL